ncbi:MAG TPA: type IV toxin-antitoxin system AbiEi family antitoxin [Jatrophihabitans sp.]|nr:type IV toxin-antitoxin system AbiEi family antitoxin [Jatrophihabitans sp.]
MGQFSVNEGPDDPVLMVDYEYGTARLRPVWAGEGFQRDVSNVLKRLADEAGQASPVIVVRRMSRGGRELAESAGFGWADESGRARVVAPPGLLIACWHPLPRDRRRSSWSEGTAAVAEVLLEELIGKDYRSVPIPRSSEIVQMSGWSSSQVSRALQIFDEQGWTAKLGPERGPASQREWRDPSAALSSWAAWHREQRAEAVSAHGVGSVDEAIELLRGISKEAWLLSGWMAADLVAPLATAINVVTVYLAPDFYDRQLRAFMQSTELREVEHGARIVFWRADQQLFSHVDLVGGLPVAGPIRIYGDLLRLGARGEDAAEHLRDVRIGF